MYWIIYLLALLPLAVGGKLDPTDTITWGGDNSRAGYQTTHKMDPAVVGSGQFGQIFQTLLPGNYRNVLEQIYAQPLVYTLNDGVQYVFIATTQNNLYKINAKTGAIVTSRNMHVPFLTSDLDDCVDINPLIGVTATGVIDPDTDTWYLTAKTYLDQTDQIKGRATARYYFHAIDVNTLQEKSGFPVDLEGTLSRNSNGNRMFQGGEAHQRPALLHTGQYIYAGFASHCVEYNFTGWVMGWDKTTGANVEAYAMEGGPEPNSVKGGGVWMSGGGLASDNQGSMFFATGNGYASQLDGISVPGHQPPTALEEAAVHMKINDDGTLNIVDFFMPWEKKQLDGADKDLGTTPLELLPTDVFTCPNVKRMGVVTGKSGKTYFLNLDNLGGYQNGENHLDAVPQVTQNENSVYAGAGVYPLEGGYIYINVIQYPTHVFKFSCDSNGNPAFTHVADSPTNNAYILGVGHGTVTSLDGQPGTGLVWTSDVEGYNLRIYNAVPSNGLLTLVNAFNVPGITKFTRPVFGNARVYLGTTAGTLYGFGSPVNLPLNCTSGINFGNVLIGSSSNVSTIQCQANTDTVITSVNLAGNKNFNISGIPQLPISVSAGSNFSFQAVFSPAQQGVLSSSVVLNTTATGYSPNTPITLSGTGESLNALLGVTPNVISYSGVITGQQVGGVNSSVIFLNQGDATLNITSIDYSIVSEGGVTVTPNITSAGPQVGPFTFINLPATIPGNSQVTVVINFNPSTSGNFAAYMTVHSNGGSKIFDVVATSGTYPRALVEFQAADGSGTWIPYSNTSSFTFGTVLEQQTKTLKMRLTNTGGTTAGRLSVTVSKPPFGVTGSIIGSANNVDLAEGTTLAAGESATADLYCSVPKSQVNVDSYNGTAQWTLNTGDPTAGKLFIQFFCNAASEQVGPVAANGSALYRYDFCAVENNPGRQLSNMLYSSAQNTNDMCITACAAAGYKYCGTQYLSECWAGNSVPIQSTLSRDCNYACAGSRTETCGGNGFFQNGSYISLFNNPAIPEGAPNPTGGNTGGAAPVSLAIPATIGAFSYVGCYTEGSAGRALGASNINSASMTLEFCATQMQAYSFFGVEYGQECYGGNTLGQGSVLATASDCSFACPGNSSEACGAGNRLQLYKTNSTILPTASSISSSTVTTSSTPSASATGPVTVGNFTGWSYLGCYSEATNGRALSDLQNPISGTAVTVPACATACSAYSNFGVEYSGECYCGNIINAGSALVAGATPDQTQCNMLCSGDSSTYCGGPNRLNMYYKVNVTTATTTSTSTPMTSNSSTSTISVFSTPTLSTLTTINSTVYSTTATSNSSTSRGSTSTISTSTNTTSTVSTPSSTFNTSSQTSSLSVSSSTVTSTSSFSSTSANSTSTVPTSPSTTQSSTLSSTTKTTSSTTTSIPSTSTSTSTTISTSSTATSSTTSSSTTTSSATISSITSSSTTSVSSTSSTTTTSSITTSSVKSSSTSSITTKSSSTTTSSTSATASATGLIVGQIPNWTYLGCYTEPSTVRALPLKSFVTSNMTAEYCASLAVNYAYFGLEYHDECWVANTLSPGSVIAPSTDCAKTCYGNSSEVCGGANRLNLYQATLKAPSTPTVVQGNTNFTYYNCVAEPSNSRALSKLVSATDSMNVETCLSLAYNYNYVGLEYGRECWASNTLNIAAVNATSQSKCGKVCAGSGAEICGDSNMLTMYVRNATSAH